MISHHRETYDGFKLEPADGTLSITDPAFTVRGQSGVRASLPLLRAPSSLPLWSRERMLPRSRQWTM